MCVPGAPLLYGGEEIRLPPAVEEIASFWCSTTNPDPVSAENFFRGFRDALREYEHLYEKITDFKKCNWDRLAQKIKATKEELKEENAARRAGDGGKYAHCLVDGVCEKVGTSRVEPPGLRRSRDPKKRGTLRRRIMPEECVMNCDKTVPPPICPLPGRAWKDVVHDDTAGWLAYHKKDGEKSARNYLEACLPTPEKFRLARKSGRRLQGLRQEVLAAASTSGHSQLISF